MWVFDGVVTAFGPDVCPELTCNGLEPDLVTYLFPDRVLAAYPGGVSHGDPWVLTATPSLFVVTPGLAVPESGLMT
jgi:hypothetical protein